MSKSYDSRKDAEFQLYFAENQRYLLGVMESLQRNASDLRGKVESKRITRENLLSVIKKLIDKRYAHPNNPERNTSGVQPSQETVYTKIRVCVNSNQTETSGKIEIYWGKYAPGYKRYLKKQAPIKAGTLHFSLPKQ